MHVVIETINVGPIKAVFVVAADEYLVAIWQIAEPIHEINRLGFVSIHNEAFCFEHSKSDLTN